MSHVGQCSWAEADSAWQGTEWRLEGCLFRGLRDTMNEWRQTQTSEPDRCASVLPVFSMTLDKLFKLSEFEFFNLLLKAVERINEIMYAKCHHNT